MTFRGSTPLNSTSEFSVSLTPPDVATFGGYTVASGLLTVSQASNSNNSAWLFEVPASGTQTDNCYVGVDVPSSAPRWNQFAQVDPAFGLDGTHFVSVQFNVGAGTSLNIINGTLKINNGAANYTAVNLSGADFTSPGFLYDGTYPFHVAIALSSTLVKFYFKNSADTSWSFGGSIDISAYVSAATLLTWYAAARGYDEGAPPFTSTQASGLYWGLLSDIVTDTVPNVVGLTQTSAVSAITTAGLVEGTVTYLASNTVPANTVLSQTPTAGTSVGVGSAVDLVLSAGSGVNSNATFINDERIGGGYFGGVLNLRKFTYLPTREPFLEGATNMIINRYKQEPTDNEQYGVDYTFFLIPGETLQTATVLGINAQGVAQASTSPLVTPLVVSNVVIDPSGLKFAYSVSGGQDGVEYTIQFQTTTQIQTSTVEEIFSINFLVENQFP